MPLNPTLWQKLALLAVQAAEGGTTKKTLVSTSLRLVRQFGGIGLVPLAALDSSIIPTFGTLDVLTAWLAIGDPRLWWYYAIMSSVGSLLGALFTYRMGKTVESMWMEKKIGAKRLNKIRGAVERRGFGAIFLAALAPPPFPTPWFFVVAGALSVPRRSFVAGTITGRLLRYGLVTLIAAHFGRRFLQYLHHPFRYAVISILFVALLMIGVFLFQKRRESLASRPSKSPKAA